MKQVKQFYKECSRVWRVTKKPGMEEFQTIVKVTGFGIIVIGLIGYVIHMINALVI